MEPVIRVKGYFFATSDGISTAISFEYVKADSTMLAAPIDQDLPVQSPPTDRDSEACTEYKTDTADDICRSQADCACDPDCPAAPDPKADPDCVQVSTAETAAPKNNNSGWMIILPIVLGVIILSVIVLLFVKRGKDRVGENSEESEEIGMADDSQ